MTKTVIQMEEIVEVDGEAYALNGKSTLSSLFLFLTIRLLHLSIRYFQLV